MPVIPLALLMAGAGAALGGLAKRFHGQMLQQQGQQQLQNISQFLKQIGAGGGLLGTTSNIGGMMGGSGTPSGVMPPPTTVPQQGGGPVTRQGGLQQLPAGTPATPAPQQGALSQLQQQGQAAQPSPMARFQQPTQGGQQPKQTGALSGIRRRKPPFLATLTLDPSNIGSPVSSLTLRQQAPDIQQEAIGNMNQLVAQGMSPQEAFIQVEQSFGAFDPQVKQQLGETFFRSAMSAADSALRQSMPNMTPAQRFAAAANLAAEAVGVGSAPQDVREMLSRLGVPTLRAETEERLFAQGQTPLTATPESVGRAIGAGEQASVTQAEQTSAAQARGTQSVPVRQTTAERKELAERLASIDTLNTITSLMGDELIGPIRGRLGTAGEVVGLTGARESNFRAAVQGLQNQVIKEITGAQMGQQEADRILRQVPSVNDQPGPFRAKLFQTYRNLFSAIRRRMDIDEASGIRVPREQVESVLAQAEDRVSQLEQRVDEAQPEEAPETLQQSRGVPTEADINTVIESMDLDPAQLTPEQSRVVLQELERQGFNVTGGQ